MFDDIPNNDNKMSISNVVTHTAWRNKVSFGYLIISVKDGELFVCIFITCYNFIGRRCTRWTSLYINFRTDQFTVNQIVCDLYTAAESVHFVYLNKPVIFKEIRKGSRAITGSGEGWQYRIRAMLARVWRLSFGIWTRIKRSAVYSNH